MPKNTLAMVAALALIAAPACYDAADDAELETGAEAGETAAEAPADPYGGTEANRAPADEAEWDAWWNERRGELDADDQEGLNEDEFHRVVVDLWDIDRDERVSTEEWSEASTRWFQGSQMTWTEWDADGDGFLDEDEVGEGAERAGLFDRVDRNGDDVVEETELREWYLQLMGGTQPGN